MKQSRQSSGWVGTAMNEAKSDSLDEQLKRSADSEVAANHPHAASGEISSDGDIFELIGERGGNPHLQVLSGANEIPGSGVKRVGCV
jgi:hypothetical protein